MSQLLTLSWLKWSLFRNSLRSSRAVVNRVATMLGMLAALGLAVVIAFGLGVAAFVLTSPDLASAAIHTKRTRGETLLALIGVVAGLGGALFGQIAPVLFRHAGSISALRWTPPGAVAYALTHGLREDNVAGYTIALLGLVAYTVILIA